MTIAFKRNRRRVIPSPQKGSVKLGGFYPAVTDSGHFLRWSPTEINPRFTTLQAPYKEAAFIVDSPHKGPPYYDGGPMQALKVAFCDPYGVREKGTYIRADGLMKYVGGFAPPSTEMFTGSPDVSNPNTFLLPLSPLIPDLSAYGSKAWNKTKPKVEYADAFVFLRELHDGVRMTKATGKLMRDSYDKILVAALSRNLPSGASGRTARAFQSSLRRARAAKMMSPRYVGDQFLNEQFGWIPFLSDLRKFDNAYTNFIEINARITMRNGQWRRRKVTVLDEYSEVKNSSGTGMLLSPFLEDSYFSVAPTWEVIERITYKIQSVGSFRYYLKEFDADSPGYESEWNRMMRQLDIFGARLSPINLYKSTPWTWANDWLNNSSSYLEYASDAVMNNLACKYFYLMGHQTREIVFRQVLPFLSGPKTLEFTRKIESKTRLEASSPFDFSLQWSALSPRQLAIALALGITRKG